MSLPDRLAPHTVDVVRPATTTDTHGNTDYDYGPSATRTTIQGWLQQDASSETFPDGRNPVDQMWLLITSHADIDENDRIEWTAHPSGTVTFTVHGPVEPAYRPGGFHHTEATLRIQEG